MVYDILIIGGGCAGPSAGVYAARLNMKSILFAEQPGGLITTTHLVENWPGIKSISGPDLGMSLWEHAQSVGVEMKNEFVQKINICTEHKEKGKPCFVAETQSGKYHARTLVFATGSVHRHLDIPGEKELANKGVSYCALCDGAFFKEKDVAVVGGGDTAAKEALYLSENCSKVYLIVRKKVLRAEPANLDSVKANKKIEILFEEEVTEILGKDKVEKLKLKSGKELDVAAAFIAIGIVPLTELCKNTDIKLNEKGEIITNRRSETNVPGIFAAGDCTDTEFKQAITAAAEGVTAAFYAFKYMQI